MEPLEERIGPRRPHAGAAPDDRAIRVVRGISYAHNGLGDDARCSRDVQKGTRSMLLTVRAAASD